jgi:hypothetical protein
MKVKHVKNNTLGRHRDAYEEHTGTILINDFMQLSQILESLKESNSRAFHALFALIEENIDLKEIVRERGERISKLQRGQTQPK